MKTHSSKTLCQKLLSFVLTFAMLISMVSVPAFAASSITSATTDTASYYVKYYADPSQAGDGTTYETAAASLEPVINHIKTAHKAGDLVTIYVDTPDCVVEDNQIKNFVGWLSTKLTSITGSVAYPNTHTATIRITSYNASNIATLAPYGEFDSTVINQFPIAGPTILENIRLVGHRLDDSRKIVVNGNDLVIKSNVQFKYLSDGKTSLWTANPFVALGGYFNRFSGYPAGDDPDVTIQSSPANATYVMGTDAPGGSSCYTSIPGDSTLRINGGSPKNVFTYYSGYSSPEPNGAAFTFKKNVNVILDNNTVLAKFGYHGVKPTVEGAIQVIRNGGATITEFDGSTLNDAPVYNITVNNGAKLDVTATAGKYNVIGGNTAYVVSADGNTITYSVGGVLTLTSAGTYTVLNAADVAAVKAANTPAAPEGKVFEGWTDNGAGTLTAQFGEDSGTEPEDPEVPDDEFTYFAKYGGTGDGRTYNTAAGNIETAISNIVEDGHKAGDLVTIYVDAPNDNTFTGVVGLYANPATSFTTAGQTPNTAPKTHAATIKITSFDADNISAIAPYAVFGQGSLNHFAITGPTILENIRLVGHINNDAREIITNGNQLTVKSNVQYKYYSEGQETLWTASPYVDLGGHFVRHGGYPEGQAPDVTFESAPTGSIFVMSTKAPGGSLSYNSFSGDATLRINGGSPKIVFTFYSGYGETSAYEPTSSFTFGKNVNLILDNATALTKYGYLGKKAAIVNGALQIIRNGGSTIAEVDTTTQNNAPVYDITVNTGAKLDVTATAGKYNVIGDNTAYVVSADGNTITYSVGGVLTLASAGTYTVLNAATLDDIKNGNTATDESGDFSGWADDGNGTLTAQFTSDTPAPVTEYFVKYGGTGDGRSYENASGDFETVFTNINTDGHDEDDVVTIYVDSVTDTLANMVSFVNKAKGYHDTHKATVKITSYNYTDSASMSSISSYFEPAATNSTYSTRFPINGPTILENIRMVSHWAGGNGQDLVMNGHDLTLNNVVFRAFGPADASSTWGAPPQIQLLSTAELFSKAADVGTDPVLTISNTNLGHASTQLVFGSKNPDTNTTKSIAGDATIRLNGGNVANVYTFISNNTTRTFTFGANVNLVLDNSTTVANFGYSNVAPTVTGAIQVIRNGGSTITNFDATTANNAPVYNITVNNGAKLDVTATAGKYNVIEGNTAYVVSADGNTITYSVGGVLTLASSGTYTVLNAADVAAVKAANTPAIPEGKEFQGWEDNGAGTLTATFADKYVPVVSHVEYFVKAGAAAGGDGTIAKPFADLRSAVSDVKKAITAEKGTATLYILPNGTEQDRHNPFDDVADGTYLSLQTINSSTYAHPNITITYKSYNGEYEGKVANGFTGDHRGSIANFTGATFYGYPFLISGPTVFEDIVLLDMRQQNSSAINANNFDIKFGANVDFYLADGRKDADGKITLNNQYNHNHTVDQQATNESYFRKNAKRLYTGVNSSYKNVYSTTAPRIEMTTLVQSATAGTSDIDFLMGSTLHSALPGATIVLPKGRVTLIHLTQTNSIAADEIFTGPLNIVLNGTTVALFRGVEDLGEASQPTITSDTVPYGLQIIKNNGATIPMHDYMQFDIYDITAENVAGFGLDVTDTVGTYAVNGGVAYSVSEDGNTITYSANDVISVSAPGKYTFKYAADLDALKSANTATAPAGQAFLGWEDNGNGTLTAMFGEPVLPDTFYAMYGGTGDGSSPRKASGDIAALIKSIDAAYGKGKEATILLMHNDTEEAKLPEGQVIVGDPADKTVATVSPYLAYDKVPAHKTTIRYKSYDVNNKTYFAFNTKSTWGSAGSNINLNGPSIFDNVTLFDNNLYQQNYAREIYGQEYSLTIIATNVVRISHTTLGVNTQSLSTNVSGGTRTWSVAGGNAAFTTEVNDIATFKLGNIGLTGYIGNTEQDNQTVTVMDGDATIVLNGNGDTVANVSVDKSHAERATTFKGNANIVLNNVKVTNLKSTSNTVVLENGALNIIKNNGATVSNDTTSASNGKKYDLTVEAGITLMPTSTVGKFAVNGTNTAYIVVADKIYYSVNGVLTVPAPGAYTVKNAADVDAIIAAENSSASASSFGIISNGWVRSETEGVLETDITIMDTFYARYGADVNANGYSAETASGSLQNLVKKIEASGNYGEGKTVTIKIVRAVGEEDIADDKPLMTAADGKTSHKFLHYSGYGNSYTHKTTIVYTSADVNSKSVLAYHAPTVVDTYGSNVSLFGPTVFKDIILFDNNPAKAANFNLNIYAGENNLTLDGISIVRVAQTTDGTNYYPRYSYATAVQGGTYTTGGPTNTSGNDFVVDIADLTQLYGTNTDVNNNNQNLPTIAYSGFTRSNEIGLQEIEGNATFKLGTGKANVSLDTRDASAAYEAIYARYKKNVNLILDGTTVKSLVSNAPTTIINGAFQVIKHNRATMPEITLSMKSEEGVTTPVYDITVDGGIKLDVTETAGTYKVIGDEIPYVVSADGKTITYFSTDTLQFAAGTHTVKSAATIEGIMKENNPVDTSGNYFMGWKDNGKGTLTATFAAERTVFYAQYGADGNGYTSLTPSGDIKALISSIEKSGLYGEGKTVTIKLMHSPAEDELPEGQIIDIDTTDKTNSYTVPYLAYSDVPAHKTKIVYTSYDASDKTFFAFLPTSKMGSAADNINVKGPTVFDNITLYDNNMYSASYRREIYCGEYDVKFVGTNVVATNHTTLGVRDPNAYANYTNIRGGLRAGAGGSGDFTVEITKFSDLFQRHDTLVLGLSGLTTVASTQVTEIDGNATFIITGDGETIPAFHVDASTQNSSDNTIKYPTTFKKNANIVLNNVILEKLTNNSYLGSNVVNVEGALNIILNDGASITTDEVTASNGNKFVLTVESGIKLMPTAEVGKFQVVGNNIAYVVSADGKTINYSVDGVLTLTAGTYTIKNAASLEALKDSVKAEGTGEEKFTGWADDNNGKLTAQFTTANDKYYIVYGGTGDGRSYENAAGSFETVFNNINADGHGAASEVTIYVDHHPEKFENILGWLTSNTTATGLPYHAATIRVTSYNFETNGKSSIALFGRPAATEPVTYGHLFAVNGPTIFENITLISHFTGNPRDIIANGHDVTLINVEYKTHDSNLNIYTCAPVIRLGASHSAYGVKGDGSEFIIDKQSIDNFTKGVDITYSTNMAYVTSPYNSFENDATLRLNGGTVTNINTASANAGAEDAVFTFKKNLNLVLNNGTIVKKFGYYLAPPTVEGAIQIIRNEGSTIQTLDTTTRNNAPVYDITAVGGKLDITDVAGTFKVEAGKYAYTTYEKGVKDIVYFGTGTITLPAGAHTVNFADSVDAIKTALGSYGHDYDNGLEFQGWTVDEAKGQITANYAAHTPVEKSYYVIAGGKGDKTGSSPENAAVSVQSLIAQINKDLLYKGDIARVYIMQVEGCPENNEGLASDTSTSTFAESTFTPWIIHTNNNNITPKASEYHKATMIVSTYNYEETKTNNYLAYSNFIGTNHKMWLYGPTVFENISLVRPRYTDREIVLSGQSVEFRGNTRFYQMDADFYSATPFTMLQEKNPTLWALDVYTRDSMKAPQSIRFASPITYTRDNYGNHAVNILGGHYTDSQVYSNYPVSYYFDHEQLMVLVGFGYLENSDTDYPTAVNNGLNIIYNNAKSLEVLGRKDTVNVKGGLQIVNNNGNKFPAIPENVKADKTWIVNSAENAGGTLDVTDTAGKFAVLGGNVAYTQSFDKKIIYYGSTNITLPEGEYNIFYADDVEAVIAQAQKPTDADAYNVFDKWVDNGDGTMTASYKVQIPAYFVDTVNGLDTNDGTTADTAFKTLSYAVSFVEATGKNAVLYISGSAVYENISAHTVTIYYASNNNVSGVITAPDSTISVMGPSSFGTAFDSAMTIIPNGYDFALAGAVDTTKPVRIVLGENNAESENLTLSGHYVDEIVYDYNTVKTNITINGAIVRRFVSGAQKTENYSVEDIKITVNSGNLYAYDHSDENNHHTEATFELIMNANSFYFDAVQYDENTTLTEFTTFLSAGAYPKIQYRESGMFVVRSADKENFLVTTDVAGVYTWNGEKVPYSISDNGQNIYYPVDGTIKLPAGTPVVRWTPEFSVDAMPVPTLPAGYKFEGWKDDGAGFLTASIIKPIVFYVDANGDDNSAGVLDAPYKTIGKALETLGATSGTIIVVDSCDFDLTKAPADRTNNVIVKGYDADSVINVNGDITVNGNITFKNIKFNGIGNVAFAGGKLGFGDGVVIASTVNIVAGSASTGAYDKVVLEDGTYTVKTASNVYVGADASADITVDSANANAVIKIRNDGTANITFANNNFANAQIINNNGTFNIGAIAQNTWVINSTVSDLRVNYSDTVGTYDLTVPYGKVPVAVGTDGTVYVAEKAEADLERPATWYETNEYAPYTYYRRPLTNTYKLLTEGKEQVDIVYFGGSLTAGYGASDSDKTSWRALMMDWFAQNFPNANIKNHNMTLGETGTFMGTYRVTENIIPCQPDLLIIEYAINDTYNDNYHNDEDFGYHAGLQFETIVREVRQAYPDCDIVALYTSDVNRIKQHREPMELHSTAAAHDRIAKAYDIPAILVGPSLANRLEGDTLDEWKADYYKTYNYNNDGVHLNDTGNYEYFKHVREFFNNELFGTDHGNEVLRTEIPAVLSDHLLDGNRTVYHMTDDLLAKSEALGGSGFEAIHNYYIHQFKGGSYTALRATSKDAVFAMEFDGTALDIVSNFQTGTRYLVSLDGGEYKEYAPTNNRPFKLFENLPKAEGRTDNKHVVRIKPLVFRTDVDYIELLALMSNDADLHTKQGATYDHKDITKYTLTVPAGSYELMYLDAATVADLQFKTTDDSLIITGWTDGENVLDASSAIEAGKSYVPVTVDVDDYLEFLGVQVRPYINEDHKQGLRFVADKSNAVDSVVDLTNFGMVLIPSKFLGDNRTFEDYNSAGGNSTNNIVGAENLFVGSAHEYNGKTYNSADVVAKNIFSEYDTDSDGINDGKLYTAVLTGITDYATLYTAKAYVRYTFNGKEYLAYCDPFRSSMYEVASFALDKDGNNLNESDKALLEEIVNSVKAD